MRARYTQACAFRALVVLALCGCARPTLAARHGAGDFLLEEEAWFSTDEAKTVAKNVLSWQSALGGWPKNNNTAAGPPSATMPASELAPTFDNSATTNELRFLARMYHATNDRLYLAAFTRGMDYILNAQYANGGWPQSYPPPNYYPRYITFNDNAMVRLMDFVRETYTKPAFAFVDDARKQKAEVAFTKGIDCILKCQIFVHGRPTAWCAQHDEKDFRPRPARTFELTSISGSESVGITELLMSLDHPSPRVIQAVEGAAAWFETSKLKGIRTVTEPDPKGPGGRNLVVISDPAAPPMWARFYDIQTNTPIYAGWDGVAKSNIAAITYERRNGYLWLAHWAGPLLKKDYPAWRAKWINKAATAESQP